MSIATVVTRGYGSFGSIAFVTTRGYSLGAAEAGGHYVETPAERKRRLERERRIADRRLERFREMSLEAVIADLQMALEGVPDVPATDAEQQAIDAIQGIVEQFRFPQGIDLASLILDATQLQALVGQLARISAEMENRQDEDAVLLLLLHQ